MVFHIPGGAVFLSSAVCLRNRSGIHFHQSELSINYWLTLYGGLKLSRSKPRELLQIGLIEKFSKESLPTFGLLLCCVAQESQTLNWSTEGLLVEKDSGLKSFLWVAIVKSLFSRWEWYWMNWSKKALLVSISILGLTLNIWKSLPRYPTWQCPD